MVLNSAGEAESLVFSIGLERLESPARERDQSFGGFGHAARERHTTKGSVSGKPATDAQLVHAPAHPLKPLARAFRPVQWKIKEHPVWSPSKASGRKQAPC